MRPVPPTGFHAQTRVPPPQPLQIQELAANNTAVHTIIIAGWEDTTPKFQWRVDNVEGQIGDVTATIPGQFTALALGIWISNGVAAAAKTMDFFGAYHKHGVREGG